MPIVSTTTHVAELGQAVRLDAWRSVFEKTNRIISERPVTVRVTSDVPHGMSSVPAWTDGEAITFNGPQVVKTLKGKDPISQVLAMKGLNYHELSHVLYTPRQGDELPRMVMKKVKDSGDPAYWYAFNALEDQRIETWFTSVFGASRRYFEATVVNWIVREGTVEAAPLVYGRKYLSSKIRVGAGKVFVQKHGDALYTRMKDVIDQYLQITFPGQSAKAYSLVVTFRDLLKEMQKNAPLPNLPVPDNGCHQAGNSSPDRSDPTVMRAGRIIQRNQRDAQEAAQEAMDEAAKSDAEAEANMPQPGQDMPTPPMDGDDAGSPGDGDDGADPGSGQGKGDKPAEKGAQGAEGQSDDQADPDAGPGEGAGNQPAPAEVPTSIEELVDAAYDALDDIESDAQILRDAEQTLDAVKATIQNGQMDAEGPQVRTPVLQVPSEGMKVSSRRIVTILQKIRADLEPARIRNQVTGRINLRKYLGRRPGEVAIFDQYSEGQEDEASVEAVVLIDYSGSMKHRMDAACGAAWALKRAFDKVGIRSTMLLYNTEHAVMYGPTERAKPGVPVSRSDGGTDPTSAYTQAMRIFAKSSAANKILCNVTDGQWQGVEAEYAKQLRTLHAMDVSTMILGLDRAVERYGKHSHKVGHDIRDMTELPKAVTKWVADVMRNVAQV